MAYTKDYSRRHKIIWNRVQYIFDPYFNGIGAWRVYSSNHVVSRAMQGELNKIMFGDANLPNMIERFKYANRAERENLKNISRHWLNTKVQGLKNHNTSNNIKTYSNIEGGLMGKMFFYIYDAKYKKILPIWDRFPMMIVLHMKTNGWLGLNLHFLYQEQRANILTKLVSGYGGVSDNDLSLTLNYGLLKNLHLFEDLKPCIKRYRHDCVRSRILPVQAHEWAYAIWLGAEDFEIQNREK